MKSSPITMNKGTKDFYIMYSLIKIPSNEFLLFFFLMLNQNCVIFVTSHHLEVPTARPRLND